MEQTPKQREAGLTNLKLAQVARSHQLCLAEKDYDKRANGENSKLDGALFNDFDSKRHIVRERPHHRTMVDMSMAGYSNNEIASATGFKRHSVSNVLRQPWAREYIIKETKKTVQDEIREVLEAEALPSIRKLVTLRDAEAKTAAEKNVQLSATNAILDRFLGKPTQPISTNQKPPSELTDDELRQEIEREIITSQNATKPTES